MMLYTPGTRKYYPITRRAWLRSIGRCRGIRHQDLFSPMQERPIDPRALENCGANPMPPDALASFDRIKARLAGRQCALFLDYDGTLAPIMPRPELAVASTRIRSVVESLAERIPVAIVSGRGLEDVMGMLGLEGIAYAGSHGFEIRDAQGRDLAGGIGDVFLPVLARARVALEERLAPVAGVHVEDKRYSIAIHYREADAESHAGIAAQVAEEAARHGSLKRTGGKMIHELRPDIAWDKGTTIMRVLEAIGLPHGTSVPVYIGDDETDEDAFRAIADSGIGIRAGNPVQATAAEFSLKDPEAVATFLERLDRSLAG